MAKHFNVLVCGGLEWDDWDTLSSTLDDIHEKQTITKIINGGTLGASYLAEIWASNRGIEVQTFSPDFKKYKTKASLIKAKKMVEEGKPDLCVVFPVEYGKEEKRIVKECENGRVKLYIVGAKWEKGRLHFSRIRR